MNYKVENMEILNRKFNTNLTTDEKIKFIDTYAVLVKENYEGIATYLTKLINDYEQAKNNRVIKRSSSDFMLMNSLKAWFRRNDTRKIIMRYDSCEPTECQIFGYTFSLSQYQDKYIENPYNRYSGRHSGTAIDAWFDGLTEQLRRLERKYFELVDAKSIKLKELKDIVGSEATFCDRKIGMYIWNTRYEYSKDISIEEIDNYINAVKELEEAKKAIAVKYGYPTEWEEEV